LLATAAGLLAAGLTASAQVDITLDGTEYAITTVNTSFNADTAQLEAQPWYNNFNLAHTAAGEVGNSLGDPFF